MTQQRLYTTKNVAKALGCCVREVRRRADQRGVGYRFGRMWLFTEACIPRLVANPRGPQCKSVEQIIAEDAQARLAKPDGPDAEPASSGQPLPESA